MVLLYLVFVFRFFRCFLGSGILVFLGFRVLSHYGLLGLRLFSEVCRPPRLKNTKNLISSKA